MFLYADIPAAPHDDYIMSGSPSDIGWSIGDLAAERYRDLRTDAQGRARLTTLIPGASHKVYVFALGQGRQAWREAKAFTVEPGQGLDLGTVVVRRPPWMRKR
jgi:hypothetical protein